MRLIFTDPKRPQDQFVIHDRTDSKDPVVQEGETFTVPDKRGRELIAAYPRLQAAPDDDAPAKPKKAAAKKTAAATSQPAKTAATKAASTKK